MPFLLEFPAAGRVEGDAGPGCLAVPVLVLLPGLRVDGLLRPGLAEGCSGIGDRGELAEHVGTAQGVAGDAVEGVVGRPGVVDREVCLRRCGCPFAGA